MVGRGKPAARRTTTARKPAAKSATTAKKPATTTRKATPATAKRAAPAKQGPDVTQYASKEPTGYHKAFARWIVRDVGYNPKDANSLSEAFLMGVSIGTAARPAFQNSAFLEEWREASGEAKRGPKAKTAEQQRRSQREVVSDDEFEDDDDEFEDEDSEDTDDDEFEDESDSDDDDEFDDEDEDEFEDDDDGFEDEEEEPAPPKRGRPASTRKAATTRGASTQRRTSAPSKKPATRSKAARANDDDEDLF